MAYFVLSKSLIYSYDWLTGQAKKEADASFFFLYIIYTLYALYKHSHWHESKVASTYELTTMCLVNILFSEVAAKYIMHVANGNEGLVIDFVNNIFQFGNFQTRDNRIQGMFRLL